VADERGSPDLSRRALPLTKQIVNGVEVDFFFPDLGLVVETDSRVRVELNRIATHLTRASDIDHT
jgi:hypothetical protein